ncbi:MAG: hypothetical protein ABIX01_10015 [Chitinophagaceae bacterium]
MSTPLPNRTIADKLDSLATVPPQHAFDATAMWSQLEQRLPKEKNRMPLYLRLAVAAALFIAILSSFFLMEATGPKHMTGAKCLDRTLVRHFNALEKTKPGTPGSISASQTAIATTPPKAGLNTVAAKRILKVVPLENPTALSANNATLQVPGKDTGMPAAANEYANSNNTLLRDTGTLSTATAVIKKKLKVVHLNESAGQDINDATASKDGSFQFKFNAKNSEPTVSETSPFRFSVPLKAKSL